ncbi:hypothetical protein K450DRAFT_299921 [Umbelopsis ramanniana AG]|uniref:Uncharacterized protein n=1 Tax=Umbelopsis ramanniana AG TaxID=1314678 RepID=A0AAD5ECY0_UMBRA|nr:uncharacterized protein K450DRAFT_299921 [Umbelopsis ramanniana AG]KAI8579955.1 hypothetical protein K450DRAFT_299921 [Umbelopsis ramanniana AG]
MSTAQFRLLYPSGSGSVSISIEDGIPKPLMKSKGGLYELERQLLRDTKYNYQVFLDDEPQQIEVFDTACAKSKSDLSALQNLSTLCLVDMDAKDQPNSHDRILGGGADPAAVLEDPPEFDHGDSHSDNETVSSELDSPLTPTRFEGFEEEQSIHSMLHEKHDVKNEDYSTPLIDTINQDSQNIIHVEHASQVTSEIQAEPNPQRNVLETSIPERKETEDHAVDEVAANDVPMANGVFVTPMAPDAEDYLDDHCIVDDLIQELREKEESQMKANTAGEVITTQLQAFSKFGPADVLRLQSMFTSFIMIIILQAVANVFSFAKASLD